MVSLTNNNISLYKSVSDAVISSRKNVKLQIEDNLSRETVDVPTFKNMSTNIDRLDSTLNTVMNLNGTESTVRMSDGSWRRLALNKVPTEAIDIQDSMISTDIKRFYSKSNSFYDNFLDPLLYMNITITLPEYMTMEKVYLRKIVIDYSQNIVSLLEENNYTNISNLDYNKIVGYLDRSGIPYTIDNEVVDVEPKECRYDGKFTVVKVTNDESTEVIIDSESVKSRFLVYLDTITYDDNMNNAKSSIYLNIDDYLYLDSSDGNITTRVKILRVDTDTNMIVVEYVEGLDYITTGSVLKLDQTKLTKTNSYNVCCSIMPGKTVYVFSKLVDVDTNLLSKNWSVGKYVRNTDELIIKINNNNVSLSTYYKNNVNDFGKVAKANAVDFYPTVLDIRYSDFTSTPTIDADLLKVVKMHTHLNDYTKEIQELSSKKINTENDITNCRSVISDLKTKLNTYAYNSVTERMNDEQTLDTKSKELERLSVQYSSYVSQITDMANKVVDSDTYHVQGFIGGENVFDNLSVFGKTINVIGYEYEYRYISTNGILPIVNEYEVPSVFSSSTNGAVKSKVVKKLDTWTLVKNPYKKRTYTVVNGVGMWKWDNLSDSSEYNKIDIPILKNSQVVVRARYVTDAGYPSNPIKSQWSPEATVAFNASNSEIEMMIDKNKVDSVKNTINDELISDGLLVHNSDSFTANAHYFAHHADNIASGFYDKETYTQITLYDKLKSLSEQLQNLVDNGDYIASQKTITVSLINTDTNKEVVLKEGTNKIELPLHEELDFSCQNAVEQKFILRISSQSRSVVYNKFGGNRIEPITKEYTGKEGEIYVVGKDSPSKTYDGYTTQQKLMLTPILIGDNEEKGTYKPNHKGQFIYIRNCGVGECVSLLTDGDTTNVHKTYKIDKKDNRYCKSIDGGTKINDGYYIKCSVNLSDMEDIQFDNNKKNSQYDVTNTSNSFKDFNITVSYKGKMNNQDSNSCMYTILPFDLFVKSFSEIIKLEYDVVFIVNNDFK